jgi:hypothetical protein
MEICLSILDVDEEKGFKTASALPPQEVERLEGEDPTNPNYVQFQWNNAGLTLRIGKWLTLEF